MNAQEFIATINRKAAEHLPRADWEFLRRYELVLGTGPYYTGDIPKAISLLRTEYEFLGKMKQEPKKETLAAEARRHIAISQIVVIHNTDAEQCHLIRHGLIQTGFINWGGPRFYQLLSIHRPNYRFFSE